jgi:hypothetical protein
MEPAAAPLGIWAVTHDVDGAIECAASIIASRRGSCRSIDDDIQRGDDTIYRQLPLLGALQLPAALLAIATTTAESHARSPAFCIDFIGRPEGDRRLLHPNDADGPKAASPRLDRLPVAPLHSRLSCRAAAQLDDLDACSPSVAAGVARTPISVAAAHRLHPQSGGVTNCMSGIGMGAWCAQPGGSLPARRADLRRGAQAGMGSADGAGLCAGAVRGAPALCPCSMTPGWSRRRSSGATANGAMRWAKRIRRRSPPGRAMKRSPRPSVQP